MEHNFQGKARWNKTKGTSWFLSPVSLSWTLHHHCPLRHSANLYDPCCSKGLFCVMSLISPVCLDAYDTYTYVNNCVGDNAKIQYIFFSFWQTLILAWKTMVTVRITAVSEKESVLARVPLVISWPIIYGHAKVCSTSASVQAFLKLLYFVFKLKI